MPRLAAILIFAVLASEAIAWWWMHPPRHHAPPEPPALALPTGPGWQDDPVGYARAAPVLRCTTGGMTAQVPESPRSPTVVLGLFIWTDENPGSTQELYRHQPETCMGAVGYEMIRRLPSRRLDTPQGPVSFDHVLFRTPDGRHVHVFKGVWTAQENATADSLGAEPSGDFLRKRLVRAAFSRSSNGSGRVFSGFVFHALTPDDAWHRFASAWVRAG